MGRMIRINAVHRNALFIKNYQGDFLHFVIIKGEEGVKIKFEKTHFGAALFLNKKNAQKFIVKNKLKNVVTVKARPLIKAAEEKEN